MSEFSELGDRLTQKAGPIPVWGWVAGAVGVYLYYKKKTVAKATPTDTTAADTTAQTSNTGDQGYAGATLAAQYDQLNALGLNTSELGVLNSNVGANNTAQAANTAATTANTSATAANTVALAPVGAKGSAQFQNAVAQIQNLIKTYQAHNQSGLYSKKIEGAQQVLNSLNPSASNTANYSNAKKPYDNFIKRGATYNSQQEGAFRALQFLPQK